MQSLINFSFSQCTDKGVFCSLFTVPLSLFLLLIFSLSFPTIAPPPHTKATSSLPRQRPSLSTAFLNNHRIPFFLSLTLLSPKLLSHSLSDPDIIVHGLNVAVVCFCRSPAELAQCTFLHFKSYILAARSILHTKIHVFKYINMLQLGLTWEMKWVIRLRL